MDVPRADRLSERIFPNARGAHAIIVRALVLTALVGGLAWDLATMRGELLLAIELGLVLFVTWHWGWRWGLTTAIAAELVRAPFQPLHTDVGAVFWILEAGLLTCTGRLRVQFREAQRRALRDPWTDLPNRRALDEYLGAELSRARRFERSLVVAVLDCDGFKRLNDQSGHATGDEALQQIGRLLRRELRHYDGVFRFGGDEFVIVLPETDQNGAEHAFERMRAAFAHEVERNYPGLTASLGVAVFPAAPADVAECLARADETMYRAKRRGPGATVFAVIDQVGSTRQDSPRVLVVE
jgi:diguanylate cyclase (GGDEF)-like protein